MHHIKPIPKWLLYLFVPKVSGLIKAKKSQSASHQAYPKMTAVPFCSKSIGFNQGKEIPECITSSLSQNDCCTFHSISTCFKQGKQRPECIISAPPPPPPQPLYLWFHKHLVWSRPQSVPQGRRTQALFLLLLLNPSRAAGLWEHPQAQTVLVNWKKEHLKC